MTNPNPSKGQAISDDGASTDPDDSNPACVIVFNVNDASGAAGLVADAMAMSSAGVHVLPVVTGIYSRDSGEIFEHMALDDEVVQTQARTVLEDMPVQAMKIGFAASPENVAAIAELASDYEDIVVVSYMPNLSWWEDTPSVESYLDAFSEMVLPQTTLLVGNYNTLCRWLLPDWESTSNPQARDIARAADILGTPYTLITGLPTDDPQRIDNVLATPHEVLVRAQHERMDGVFLGAGETLSAALTALIANGTDLGTACTEALSYLDRSLQMAFRPGMGHLIADRFFWAQSTSAESDSTTLSEPSDFSDLFPGNHDVKH